MARMLIILMAAVSTIYTAGAPASNNIVDLTWNSMGQLIATVDYSGKVTVLNSLTQQIAFESHHGFGAGVAWHPIVPELLAVSTRTLGTTLFDIDAGVVVHHYDTSVDTYSVAFSPDGQYIITSHGTPGDGPLARGYVAVTEIATGINPVVFEDVPQRVAYADWNSDGSLVAGLNIGEYGEIVLWNANTGEVLQRLTESEDVSIRELGTYFVGNISDFAWSPNDDMLAVSIELHIAFWNSTTRSRVGASDYLFAIDDISWHPNEPFVAVASGYERRIQIIDVNSGKLVGVIPTSFDVMAVSWSPDGTRLAYGGKTDHLVEVTDIVSMLTPTLREAKIVDISLHSY